MANNTFVFKDNTDIILKQMYKATEDAAEEMGEAAKEAVQWQILYGYKDRHGPDGHTEIVDTGALYDSIEARVRRVSGNDYDITVGTDRPYAKFVHNGTRYLKARHFITDALQKSAGKLRDILLGKYKNG